MDLVEGAKVCLITSFSQSSLRTPGVGVGLGSACGVREKKRVNCCLDSASAMGFSFPGR